MRVLYLAMSPDGQVKKKKLHFSYLYQLFSFFFGDFDS